MPDIINATKATKTKKKGVGSGNNRPKQIKEVKKIGTYISVDPLLWQKAKQKFGRKLSSKIQDYLEILVKD